MKEIIAYEMTYSGGKPETPDIVCLPFDESMWDDYMAMYNECFHEMREALEIEPYDFYSDISQIKGREENIFVFFYEGRLAGSVSCIGNELDDLTVRKDHRRRGFGRRLLRFGMTKILENGYSEVVLHAAEYNAAAVRMYLDEGFVITSKQKVR